MKKIDPRTRLAEIRWIPADEGGRVSPPSGNEESSYAPTVRLLDSDDPGSDGTLWKLSLRKLEEGEDESEWLAEIAFALDAAPHDALTTGRRFELFEGARCVALGKILGFAGDRSPCLAMGGSFE